MTCYQIKDWDSYFENERSRNVDRCGFVCVPNKQHGMGFSRVMAEPDGAAIYGIFACILGACSQQKRPRCGWLTDNGLAPVQPPTHPRRAHDQPAGAPWDATDLAIKFRRPVTEVVRALEVLSSQKVGWIVAHNVEELSKTTEKPNVLPQPPTNPQPAPDAPTNHPPRMEGNGMEQKGTEGKEDSSSNPPPSEKTTEPQAAPAESDKAFELFWSAYPKKAGKLAALKAFNNAVKKIQPNAKQGDRITVAYSLAEAAKAQAATIDWLKEDGKFIPHPATWLNQGRWMDETKKPEDRYEGAFATP